MRFAEAQRRDEPLTEWARVHDVRWEITRHFELVRDAKAQVGFELVLSAKRPSLCKGDPACRECAHAHEQLEEVARAVLPPGTRHVVGPFDGSFHLSQDAAPELLLTVEILPRAETTDSDDQALRRVVAAVESGLCRLGLRRHGAERRASPIST